MPRTTLFALAALYFIAGSVCISDDTGAGRGKFTVKCVVSPSEVMRTKSEKLVLEEGVETDIRIESTVTSNGGLRGEYESINVFIPREAMTRRAEDLKAAEAIPMGPHLKLRVDKLANEKLLLDATLSDGVVTKNSPQRNTFNAVTTQVRCVQQVHKDETISVSWPVREGETEPRQVQITISQVE